LVNIVRETAGLRCPPDTPPAIVIAAKNAAAIYIGCPLTRIARTRIKVPTNSEII
jgi:hypothetical protein